MRFLPRPRTAALAVVAVAGLALLAACGSDDADRASDETGTQTSPHGSHSPSGSSTSPGATSPTSSAPGGSSSPQGAPLPIYFVGDTPRGPRLYREFQPATSSDRLTAAVQALTTGSPQDSDYSSALSGLSIAEVRSDDGSIEVALADGAATSDDSMSASDAELAVQQLVYTLDGVTQTHDPVVVTQGGRPVRLFGQRTDTGVKAADPLAVLALVNVTEPEQGSTASGTLHASGVASSFEGSVPWTIHAGSSDGRVVKSGSTQASGYLDKLYPWKADIDISGLPVGDYTFVAMTDDPSGGKEGGGPSRDTKTFTIQ